MNEFWRGGVAAAALTGLLAVDAAAQPLCPHGVLTGAQALASSWRDDAPLVCRQFTPADLPPPAAATTNPPSQVDRPADMRPTAPPGFTVTLAYSDRNAPRLLRTAPNGDLFVSETDAGVVRVLRPDGHGGLTGSVFASGLDTPFGVAFYKPQPSGPGYVYVAETGHVIRYPYRAGDLVASGPAETVAAFPAGGNHATRDVVFDDGHMLVGVGSASNDAEDGEADDRGRAAILDFPPDGGRPQVFASGLRNPVSLVIEPQSGRLWTVVNERDQLGDNLVPDYVTHVQQGRFYGWPWYYIGGHLDPRHREDAPKVDGVVVPDLLLASHSAPLGLVFGAATAFPAIYRQGAFVTLHGSWNRAHRNGGKVVFVPADGDGLPRPLYQDFLTGFTIARDDTPDGSASWGRPVGVAVGADGALYVSDDWARAIWRVAYLPNKP